jgi:outer membrane biosynthesis protein TonB
MRLRPVVVPLFLLLAILITACTNAVEFVDPDAQLAGTSPSAADINAAADQAAEQPTATGETIDNGDVAVDATEDTAADEQPTAAPAETTAPEPSPTETPAGPLPTKSPQVNRRVEVPDNLRVNWLIPWDGIRPIYNPEFVPAGNAPLEDDELIIGVAWDGEAKAYSISTLRSREMVNDELAGIPTLVTW